MEWLLMIVLQNDQVIAGRSFANQQQCEIVAQRSVAEIKAMNAKIDRDLASCGIPEIVTMPSGQLLVIHTAQSEQCRAKTIKSSNIPKTKNYYCIAG